MAKTATADYPLDLLVECPNCDNKFSMKTNLKVTTIRQEDGVLIEVKDRVPCKCTKCGAYMQIAIDHFHLKFGLEMLETN